jgi:hypothetical protein
LYDENKSLYVGVAGLMTLFRRNTIGWRRVIWLLTKEQCANDRKLSHGFIVELIYECSGDKAGSSKIRLSFRKYNFRKDKTYNSVLAFYFATASFRRRLLMGKWK